jgi:leader peptidase (prepilin peptidase)/N-methyltransferase
MHAFFAIVAVLRVSALSFCISPRLNRAQTRELKFGLPVRHPTRAYRGFFEALGLLWHIRDVVIAFFFLFGSVLGSFLNVCITRIPEGLSIVAPASRCPRCETQIKAYDNVPVFAWLWLRGKCRSCGLAISPMYPLVEFLTGLLFVACYLDFGLTQTAVKWLFFTCLVIVLTVTDLRVRLLPDLVNWPGFAVGLFFSALVPPEDGMTFWISASFFHRMPPRYLLGLTDGLLGAAFGSLLLWGAATLYRAVRGREGMGMGDIKMMAMVGAFMGLRGAFLTVLLGTFLGSVVGIALIVGLYTSGWQRQLAERASRRNLGTVKALRWAIASQYQLPLGTFLGFAALLVVYLEPLLRAHWRLFIG